MKLLIGAMFAVAALGAHAEESLDQMKKMANEHMTQKIESIQTARTCIDNAKTKEAFKACKYDMHQDMKMQKMEMMKDKKEKMED